MGNPLTRVWVEFENNNKRVLDELRGKGGILGAFSHGHLLGFNRKAGFEVARRLETYHYTEEDITSFVLEHVGLVEESRAELLGLYTGNVLDAFTLQERARERVATVRVCGGGKEFSHLFLAARNIDILILEDIVGTNKLNLIGNSGGRVELVLGRSVGGCGLCKWAGENGGTIGVLAGIGLRGDDAFSYQAGQTSLVIGVDSDVWRMAGCIHGTVGTICLHRCRGQYPIAETDGSSICTAIYRDEGNSLLGMTNRQGLKLPKYGMHEVPREDGQFFVENGKKYLGASAVRKCEEIEQQQGISDIEEILLTFSAMSDDDKLEAARQIKRIYDRSAPCILFPASE